MAVLSPPFLLGAAGQVMSGRLARLSLGASWRPATSGVQVVSGVLAGPPNTQGELALPSGTQLTVQPFRAVIQSALDATAGAYEVVNDAQVTLAVTAQHATQFRRSLAVVRVDDSQVSGVASSGTTDRAVLEVLDGGLAASAGAAALPAPAGSWLALGEVLIPPTGQTVTLTPYNPRTGLRHGILPVIADGSTVTGHDGAVPAFDGQYRSHPTRGLQRGASGNWDDPIGLETLTWTANAAATWVASLGSNPLRLYRTGRQMRLEGIITHNTPGFSAGANAEFTIINMSAGAPAAGRTFIGYSFTGSGNTWVMYNVKPDGTVSFISPVALSTGMSLAFAGVTWLAGL